MDSATGTAGRILRLRDVLRFVGLSRSSLYRLVAAGDFPQPVPLGARTIGWVGAEIDDWLTKRIQRRRTT